VASAVPSGTPDRLEQRYVATVLGGVAAAEREFASERIRSKLSHRSARGQAHGRFSYGWLRDKAHRDQ
jgi:DNA invertase Pin-like site-specific DNA recombinase